MGGGGGKVGGGEGGERGQGGWGGGGVGDECVCGRERESAHAREGEGGERGEREKSAGCEVYDPIEWCHTDPAILSHGSDPITLSNGTVLTPSSYHMAQC